MGHANLGSPGSVQREAPQSAKLISNRSFPPHHAARLRTLAIGVMVSALLLFVAEPSQAQTMPPDPPCDQVSGGGTTVTCTGNVATGVLLDNAGGPFTTINVDGLTAAITPAVDDDGIRFTSNGPVTLNSNLGAFLIATTGSGVGIFAASTQAVHVTSVGNIATSGDFAPGILAGSNNAEPLTISSTGNITTTGANASGISGGAIDGTITITSVGTIMTSGISAHGINAGAIDGPITITSTGNIMTTGAGAGGINAGAINGPIAITSSGDVTTTGLGSNGISAASFGDATVTIASGSVSGGSGGGAGVAFLSSATNALTNYGAISALSGTAISAGIGNDLVDNSGTVTGDVDLGRGTNAFNNLAGGTFNVGADVNLGAGNTLTNAGTLSPGGTGTIRTTALSGNLVQTSTGVFVVDINGAAADRVNVSGSASLAGAVQPNVLSRTATAFTILSAAGGVTNNGLTLQASPALDATLLFNATDVVLAFSVDFLRPGLNGNQAAIAANLNAALAAGQGGLGPLMIGLLNTSDDAAYKAALDQLSPELYSDAQIAALYSSLGFANSLLSCKVNGTTTASIIHEGQCLWAGASAVFLDQGTTSQQIGFNQSTGLFAAGAQVALANAWRLGVGAGYQTSSLGTATNATSEGQIAQGGVALKYNPGPWLLAGVVNGGHGWYDTTRPMAFGGFTGTATSNSGIDIFNGGLRAAYVLGSPDLYFKPMLDAAATRLDLGDFSESGGGAANLAVASSQQTVYTIAPSLEIGTEWWWSNGTLVRPYLRGGATWYENGNLALSAAFLGSPAGVSPFTITTKMDDVMGTVGAGIDIINGNDAVLHVAYDGQFGSDTQISAIALKGSARF